MDRETKELTSPDGKHKVVIKSYLTGREANEAKAVLLQGVTSIVEPGERPKLPLTNSLPYERKILELLVVSFDGSPDNALERLEDLPSAEYDALVADIKKESGVFLAPAK